MKVKGFVVRETEAAIAFVRESDASVAGVRPLWVPRKKIAQMVELDLAGRKIATAQDGERIGIPAMLEVDNDFADKVKLAA
jgi:hypothetical protein